MSTNIKTVKAGCPKCGALGHHGENPIVKDNPFCPDCAGGGTVIVPVDQSSKCPACSGKGYVAGMPCEPCATTGKIVTKQTAVASKPGETQDPIDALHDYVTDHKDCTSAINEAGLKILILTKANAEIAAKIESLTTENTQLTTEIGDLKKTIKGLSKALKDAEKRAAPTERGPAKASDILAGVAGTAPETSTDDAKGAS